MKSLVDTINENKDNILKWSNENKNTCNVDISEFSDLNEDNLKEIYEKCKNCIVIIHGKSIDMELHGIQGKKIKIIWQIDKKLYHTDTINHDIMSFMSWMNDLINQLKTYYSLNKIY